MISPNPKSAPTRVDFSDDRGNRWCWGVEPGCSRADCEERAQRAADANEARDGSTVRFQVLP